MNENEVINDHTDPFFGSIPTLGNTSPNSTPNSETIQPKVTDPPVPSSLSKEQTAQKETPPGQITLDMALLLEKNELTLTNTPNITNTNCTNTNNTSSNSTNTNCTTTNNTSTNCTNTISTNAISTNTISTNTTSTNTNTNGNSIMKHSSNPEEIKKSDNESTLCAPSNEKCIYLPEDVLFLIFGGLGRKELIVCRMVSKFWKKVSEDERLSWFQMKEFAVMLSPSPMPMPTLDPRDSFQLVKGRFSIDINLCSNRIAHVAEIVLGYDARLETDFVVDYFTNFKERKLWNITVTPLIKEMRAKVTVDINLHVLQTMVKAKEEFLPTELAFLRQYFNSFLNNLKRCDVEKFKEENIPETKFARKKVPPEVRVKLYNYQQDAMSWMIHVESQINVPLKYCKLLQWKSAHSDIYYDIRDGQTLLHTKEEALALSEPLLLRGGVLADEMGLGKTLEIISLIAANPFPKTDPSVGQFMALKEDDYLFTSNDKYEPTSPPLYRYSRATAIFCPNHLVKQWKEEIEQFSDMRVAKIATIREFRSYTSIELCNYDIVIVSYQFLDNKNYLERFANHNKRNVDPAANHIPLGSYFWHRIVLDEGHDIVTGRKKVSSRWQSVPVTVNFFPSRYRWYVSGTPFPSNDALFGVFKFLMSESRYHLEASKSTNYQHFQYSLEELLCRTVFWRNTKRSIGTEFEVPDYQTELVLIDFHPVETALYEDAQDDQEKRLEVCCNPFLNHERRFWVSDNLQALIEQQNLELLRGRMTRLREEEFKKVQEQYVLLKQEYEDAKVHFYRTGYTRTNLEIQLHKLEEELKEAKRKNDIWEQLEPLNISQQTLNLLKPKNRQFYEIKRMEIEAMNSSQLREQLSKRKLPVHGNTATLQNRLMESIFDFPKTLPSLADLICTRGSKVAHVITYLRRLWKNQPKAKVIIFSKFNWMLYLIGNLLELEAISSVFVVGNVHRRNKAISAFSTDCKVILLGLTSAASGTNLTQATHVLLVDPMMGTAKEIKATESQAIARAHRKGQKKKLTICRFFIKNTIEYSNFLGVYGDSEKAVIRDTATPETWDQPLPGDLVQSEESSREEKKEKGSSSQSSQSDSKSQSESESSSKSESDSESSESESDRKKNKKNKKKQTKPRKQKIQSVQKLAKGQRLYEELDDEESDDEEVDDDDEYVQPTTKHKKVQPTKANTKAKSQSNTKEKPKPNQS
uniref:F-box domain-containing protein n=1 Tax=Arcella intermedia TaxID=1963864 RepID=A0A6B2KWZ7_9EUKA